MGKKEDIKLVEEFKRKLTKKISVMKLILFGSRVSGKSNKHSDFDLIIVSSKFNNLNFVERGSKMYDYWDFNYPVDFICYNPEEFNRLKNRISIVKEAIENGIEI